jgi:hypothetical protein
VTPKFASSLRAERRLILLIAAAGMAAEAGQPILQN